MLKQEYKRMTASLSQRKATLRKKTLQQRDALDESLRIEHSLLACEYGEKISIFSPATFVPGTIVAGFHPIRSEIDPRPLMAYIGQLGGSLCLPIVLDKETIVFRELIRGAAMVECGFGTVGPDENAKVLNPDILLVPLSVFDRKGGRIGYGAGHYDRAIERLEEMGKEPILIGMAFGLQETQDVPVEHHDQQLDGILTETDYIPVSC